MDRAQVSLTVMVIGPTGMVMVIGDMVAPSASALAQCEAVALFIERAQEVKPDFHLTKTNVSAVAGICVRLDGLPLTIELAAVRIKQFPPYALLPHLSRCLPLLSRSQLGARAFAVAWDEGRTMTPEQVLGRKDLYQGLGDHRRLLQGSDYADRLAARKVEILGLMVRGATNAQVAEHLIIGSSTVNNHLTAISSKTQLSWHIAANRYAMEHYLDSFGIILISSDDHGAGSERNAPRFVFFLPETVVPFYYLKKMYLDRII